MIPKVAKTLFILLVLFLELIGYVLNIRTNIKWIKYCVVDKPKLRKTQFRYVEE